MFYYYPVKGGGPISININSGNGGYAFWHKADSKFSTI